MAEVVRYTEAELRHKRIALQRELERARETRTVEEIERELQSVNFLLGEDQ